MAKIHENCKYKGIRVLITDTVKDPIEAHNAYEGRYQVELAFNTMKSRLNCDRFRVHNDKALEGKIFIQVLATSLLMMIRNRIFNFNKNKDKDPSLQKVKTNVIYDSDRKLLRKLNNIMAHSSEFGVLFDEIVGKRKDLLKILGVPLPGKENAGEIDNEEQTNSEENLAEEIL